MLNSLIILLLPLFVCAMAWLMSVSKRSSPAQRRQQQLEDRINSILPQTQCGKCDYAGCRPYARAIARNEVDINRCPPGGRETMNQIAMLLGRDHQTSLLKPEPPAAQIALIDEELCIGCVKCVKACPVDAIIGAAKQMHSVIDKACTGCELCLPPCPVNCITLLPVNVEIKKWVWTKPQLEAGV